ncbi:MAG: COX15/CtaA family protein [Actinomycetota bacterium]|nr:COX15/CtaA family protein [Actinomycetota bacterium]MDP2288646.1 COX15/CtaA family protein [Actinomycetota bacterium]
MTAPATLGRAGKPARAIYIANLVAQAAIIVTGATVRLTGSGLGCPTWPQCVEGSYVPVSHQEQGWHKYIEFGNRSLTFVLVLLAIAALVAAFIDQRSRVARGGQRRGLLLLLAAIPLIGTLAQAILGGITVLTGLHPITVSLHFLISMGLVAGVIALVVRSGDVGDRPLVMLVRREVRALTWLLVGVTGIVVVLGTLVTGSGPHSGDANAENRFSFDPRTISWIHADVVLLFIGLLAGLLLALYLTRAPRRVIKTTWTVVAISLAQAAIGYIQYFTNLPTALVLLHVTGAVLLWIAILFVLASERTRGQEVAD